MLWRCDPPGGDLAEDGAQVFAVQTYDRAERCPVCRRRPVRWRIDVDLPSPFPLVRTMGRGCSRTHALVGAPASWADVADVFTAAADVVREADPYTEWDARQAGMRDGQAERAAGLAGWEPRTRRLALQQNPRLDTETVERVVASVLADPAPHD